MKLNKLTQPGWGNAANYFHEGNKKYGISKLKVLAVVKLQTDNLAAAPAPTSFGEYKVYLDSIAGNWQILQGTS